MILLVIAMLAAQGPSLRGLHAVDANTIWASGSKGTVLLSTDAGKTWSAHNPPGAESLDFRSIFAFSASTAYVLSSGANEKSQLFRTNDGGQNWTLLYTSHEGFLDSLKFWDAQHGIILGDPVKDSFTILITEDAGRTWAPRQLPPAQPGEGAFAASNSSLAIHGKREAWFGTSGARIFHTQDGGATWTVAQTPIRHDAKTAGIFSIFFQPDGKHGVIVGGDYTKDQEDSHNVAFTADGGKGWMQTDSRPTGYRSAVVCRHRTCIATGPGGSDKSKDGGQTWTHLKQPGYHALTVAGSNIYASGSDGRLAQIR